MRTLMTWAAVSLVAVAGACTPKNQGDNAQPNPATTATGYPGYPPGYVPPPQAQPGPYPTAPYAAPTATYPQQPYPPPAQPTAQPMPAPTAAPAASGQMAVPGPIAFQCQNDVPCGTHHCNMQYGKCAFPCQSAADCIAPNSCMAGFCVPAPPQPH